MPKQLLTGTLEEQCAFLYGLAEEKMAAGNYTGAIHALKEILKYKPDYPGATELMSRARAGKREVAVLLWLSFGGAIVGFFLGWSLGLTSDLWLLGVALLGAVAGFLVGNALTARRSRTHSSA